MEKQNNSFSKNIEVIWSRNSSASRSKSLPVIKEINIDESAIKVKKSTKSHHFSRDISNNECSVEQKCVKRSLFQEKKKKKRNSKKSYADLKLSCPKSPIFLLNRGKLMLNQDPAFHNSKQRLFQNNDVKTEELLTSESFCDKPIITSSYTMNGIDSRTKNLFLPKSPETILSTKRQSTRGTHLDCKNDFINDKFQMINKCIPQAPTKFVEKSENANVHQNVVNTNMHAVDSEDIIESSETINLPFKQKTKKNGVNRGKNTKVNDCINGNEIRETKPFASKIIDIKLQRRDFKKNSETVKTNRDELRNNINFEISPEILKSNKIELSNKINFDSLDFINTGNMLKSPRFDSRIKNTRKKSKKLIIEPQEKQNLGITVNVKDEIKLHQLDTNLVPASVNSKKIAEKILENNLRTVESFYKVNDLNMDPDKSKSFTHSSEIRVIPATPEHDAVNVGRPVIDYSPEHDAVNVGRHAIDYSPENVLNSNVPRIEVDLSPKTPHGKSHHGFIQSVQTPPRNECAIILPSLFDPVTSPTQSFIDPEQQFKIDTMESPNTVSEYENMFVAEVCKNKANNSPSPNRFDSAKKRRKICKDGLRGKFRDLINRKKSEACIREYEKNLSKSYQPKESETALLNVIEAWKEFRTFVLLCYYMKSDTEVQKVLVTLENCPKNVTKNSIIRIYSPWLTIKSENTETFLFVGVIHAEVIEISESTRLPEPKGLFSNFKGLLTTVFQNEVVWECNCSEGNTCQCLGDLSTFNYLKYMIS